MEGNGRRVKLRSLTVNAFAVGFVPTCKNIGIYKMRAEKCRDIGLYGAQDQLIYYDYDNRYMNLG